jgi:hypothetical protein
MFELAVARVEQVRLREHERGELVRCVLDRDDRIAQRKGVRGVDPRLTIEQARRVDERARPASCGSAASHAIACLVTESDRYALAPACDP